MKRVSLSRRWIQRLIKCCAQGLYFFLNFELYLYCSRDLLDMVANRAKSKSLSAADLLQRLPQLTGQSTATVDCEVDWWWHALGLDLIDWPLTAIADWLWADYKCSLSCICLLSLDQFLSFWGLEQSWTFTLRMSRLDFSCLDLFTWDPGLQTSGLDQSWTDLLKALFYRYLDLVTSCFVYSECSSMHKN